MSTRTIGDKTWQRDDNGQWWHVRPDGAVSPPLPQDFNVVMDELDRQSSTLQRAEHDVHRGHIRRKLEGVE